MRDNPALADVPLAVGGSPQRRGVVATCNYAARKFGIHSAMPSATAVKKCKDLIIVRPNMEKYREASQQIHEIFRQFTDEIEPLSLDEAYLDVSACDQFHGSATLIAQEIRRRVYEKVRITISAGIAPNKFLAKIASDWNKPNGQFVITPAEVEDFVVKLPVKKLFGVGKVTARKMEKMGLHDCGDLRALRREELDERFGSFGERLYNLSRGIDSRAVQTTRIRKSLSVENTYVEDLQSLAECIDALPKLHAEMLVRLKRIEDNYAIAKQFIKVKFHDFSRTTVETLSTESGLDVYRSLCEEGYARGNKPVRLLGMGVRLSAKETKSADAVRENQLSFSLDGKNDANTE